MNFVFEIDRQRLLDGSTGAPIASLQFSYPDKYPVTISITRGNQPHPVTGTVYVTLKPASTPLSPPLALLTIPVNNSATATGILDTYIQEMDAWLPAANKRAAQFEVLVVSTVGGTEVSVDVPAQVSRRYNSVDQPGVTVAEKSLATQAEAEAGTNNTKWMSPLRVAQAISHLAEFADTTDELSEGTNNLYFREARAKAALADELSEIGSEISGLNDAIDAEETARIAGDTALQTGVYSKYQLPAPDIFLRPWAATTQEEIPNFPAAPLQTLAAGAPGPALTLRTGNFTGRLPFCRALDLPAELLAARRLFFEFVILRGHKQFVPTAHYADNSWPLPWPRTFWTRAGDHRNPNGTRFSIDRPNHLEINEVGALLPAWRCLNARLVFRAISYNTADGQSAINLPCPAYAHRGGAKKSRSYSDAYHLFRFAFRYVLWDPAANAGRGQVIPGPLSRPMVLRHHTFPFIVDHYASSLADASRSTLAAGFNPSLMTVDFAK